MLDVHPPHEAAHSWKDFLIHITTIVIGLLIAIGLEQSVEWVHRNNELRETRSALAFERKLNISRSVYRAKEFNRITGKLQTDLAIFQYLSQHPGAPPDQWPGKLSWSNLALEFEDEAWQVALKSNVVAYMPQAELGEYSDLYSRLASSNKTGALFIEKARQAGSLGIREPDPSKLTKEQIDRERDLIFEALYLLVSDGNNLVNLSDRFPAFSSPTRQELADIRRSPSPPEDAAAVTAIQQARRAAAAELEKETHE